MYTFLVMFSIVFDYFQFHFSPSLCLSLCPSLSSFSFCFRVWLYCSFSFVHTVRLGLFHSIRIALPVNRLYFIFRFSSSASPFASFHRCYHLLKKNIHLNAGTLNSLQVLIGFRDAHIFLCWLAVCCRLEFLVRCASLFLFLCASFLVPRRIVFCCVRFVFDDSTSHVCRSFTISPLFTHSYSVRFQCLCLCRSVYIIFSVALKRRRFEKMQNIK